VYSDFKQMAIREAKLKDGIEAVAIVTPNHVHYAAAKEFLKRGIHVICDKPLTSTLSDAKKLKKAADDSEALFVLTHNYTGYPMVRQARAMVENGDIGAIRLV
ncbi:Gfo/Idh/MocA family protein, partial [Ensifer sp. ENS11]